MRAAIYNPYLDTLGGGERYVLAFAKVLLDSGWEVDLQWQDKSIKEKFPRRFGMNLEKIGVIPDIKKGLGYDLCLWVSDGSIPLLSGRKNILLFQAPFCEVEGRSLLNKMKLFRINKVICYSEFVKKIIDKEYGIKSFVLAPPVDVLTIKPKRKENLILYVGRFSNLLQAKGQDVLIRVFKKLQATSWELILAGGVEVGTGDYLDKLKKLASGFSIEIVESPSFREITALYGKAKIFWSATGFGADVKKNPQKVEHFGITTVEAMAAGAVPVVFNAGGFKEIVQPEVSGYLWENQRQLISYTQKLIQQKSLWRQFSKQAIINSKRFGHDRFEKEILKLL